MRAAVIIRDGGCVAPKLDPTAGPCYDRWGSVLSMVYDVEVDYVRLESHGKRHELASDHVAVCAGHHRGTGPSRGYQWATAHRRLLREYLETVRSDRSEEGKDDDR
jgi:hypothetical protein